VLLYDLTSTYIEGEGHNRHLASRPKRSRQRPCRRP
jgi:hypothetical protein